MAAHARLSAVAAAAIALGACWQPPPAPRPPPQPPAPRAVIKPRGMLLIARTRAEAPPTSAVFWNDLDAGTTGELERDVLTLWRAQTMSRRGVWLSGDDVVLRIARAPSGGAAITEIAVDKIWAVSPDGTQAIIGCAVGSPCQLAKLTEAGIAGEKPVGASLDHSHKLDPAAWLSDGRILYQDTSPRPQVWFVEPATDRVTRGPILDHPAVGISEDGVLVAWTSTSSAHTKLSLRWRRLREDDTRARSIEIPGRIGDCRFTSVTRLVYCVISPLARKTDDPVEWSNRLVVIDPATGRSRELARDVALAGTHATASSPDGRYIAYTAGEQHLPMIVDVVNGETFVAGPPSLHAAILGWLASPNDKRPAK